MMFQIMQLSVKYRALTQALLLRYGPILMHCQSMKRRATFASQNEGVMHACGHDGHISILLGAAAVLQSIKDELYGAVKLVFQPSEEEALFPGAQGIVDSGILDDVDEILDFMYGLNCR